MKTAKDEKCVFKALFEKMEKLDRDMRDVKETLLRLKEQILNPDDLAQLQTEYELFTTGENTDDH
ncbi:MAG TPA: hypothetical protein EYN67_10535 [Flavobacteriales bacterium]|nr:hypothetical protein [Flavobacteriales bacterium]